MSDEAGAAEALPELDEAAYQRALAVLVDVGTALARQLKQAAPEATVIARAAAYERVALAVRRSILLSRDLAENGIRPASHDQARSEAALADRRKIACKLVIRAVQDNIDQAATPADVAGLRLELIERVESPDFELDLANRTTADLVRELTRDLGLAVSYDGKRSHRRRTPEDIAILNDQAAIPFGAAPAQAARRSLPKPADTPPKMTPAPS